MTERLYRSRDDRMLAGVAGGVADYFDTDPVAHPDRLGRAGLPDRRDRARRLHRHGDRRSGSGRPDRCPGLRHRSAPRRPDAARRERGRAGRLDRAPGASIAAGRRHRDPADRARGGLVIGALLIVLGGLFLIRQVVPAFDFGLWWPIGAIGLGVLLIVVAISPSRRSG